MWVNRLTHTVTHTTKCVERFKEHRRGGFCLLSGIFAPFFCLHDLRHTFATLALQNGVDIKTVSGMLGHFSAGFTLDTYAHVTTSAKREAAKTMGNILSGAV